MLEFAVFFAAFYMWHMLGVTVGYHRLISHRSFKCNKLVEYFFVMGGYLAFEGSPIWWATMHRAHHRYSDTPLDPHSPRNGLFEAFFGWTLHGHYPGHIDPKSQSKDLLKDGVYRFLEQGGNWYRAFSINLTLGLAFRVMLFFFFGWQAAVASLAAAYIVQQVPLMLNVVCHIPRLGYANFATTDDSVNVWWVALITMGEGWHNNHHANPGSARSGVRPHEIDVSWQTIKLLKMLGLVTWTNDGPKARQERRLPLAARRPYARRPAAVPVAVAEPHALRGRIMNVQD